MTKKSTYYMVLISLMVLITSSNLTVKTKAHPPESINMGYVEGTQTLTVTIVHGVDDPFVHYINQVIIRVNGSQVLSTPYTNQSSVGGGTYVYTPIVATSGSRIEAIATCIESGSMSACIIVGVGPCPTSSGPGIPGYLGLWLIIGISIVVSLMITYKRMKRRK
ncbi:MAG: hypothetical protein ACW98D_09015 [Promethearchaeota archaeon]|jgi:hypothetical protein